MAMREKMWLLPSHFASPDGDRVLYCITVGIIHYHTTTVLWPVSLSKARFFLQTSSNNNRDLGGY